MEAIIKSTEIDRNAAAVTNIKQIEDLAKTFNTNPGQVWKIRFNLGVQNN